MTLPLRTDLLARVERSPINPVPLVVITSYTQRGIPYSATQEDRRFSQWAVDRQWYFSDIGFSFDGVIVDPYHIAVVEMNRGLAHVEDDVQPEASGFFRGFTLNLLNGKMDSGEYLIEEMEAHNIGKADVMYGHILVDRLPGESEQESLRKATFDDFVPRFRGIVQRPNEIKDGSFDLFCNAHTPRNGVGRVTVNEQTTNADLYGSEQTLYVVPNVYGKPVRVPAIPFEVGYITSLAEPMDATQLTAVVTEMPPKAIASGPVVIGGERMDYSSASGTALTVVRGSTPADHSIGETVFFVSAFVSYTMAANVGAAVDDVYIRNPLTDRVFRIASNFGQSARTFPSGTVGFGYSQTTWSSLLAQAIDSALVTQQASYGGGTPATLTQLYDTSNTIASDPAGLAVDGSWAAVSNWWEFGQDDDDPKLMVQWTKDPFTGGAPPASEVTEVRLDVTVDVTFVPASTTSVVFEAFVSTTPWAGGELPIVISDPELQTVGTYNYSSLPLSIGGQGVTIADVEAQTVLRAFFEDVTPSLTSGGYDARVKASLHYTYTDTTQNPLTTPAEIQAAAGAAGIEAYADVRGANGSELDLEPDYRRPLIPLWDTTTVGSGQNEILERHTTAFHRFIRIRSNQLGATSFVDFLITLDTPIDVTGSTDPDFPCWLAHRAVVADDLTTLVELIVSDSANPILPPVGLPANYTRWIRPPTGDLEFQFTIGGNVGTGADLTDVKYIRIGMNLSIQPTDYLDVWYFGANIQPSSVYGVSPDGVPRHPVDHYRRFMTADANMPPENMDEDSLSQAKADAQDVSLDVSSSDYTDAGDTDLLANIGRESTVTFYSEEAGHGTVFRAIAPNNTSPPDYVWPAPAITLTRWQEISERFDDAGTTFTKRLYSFDPDRTHGLNTRAMKSGLSLGLDQNDDPGQFPDALVQGVEDTRGRTDSGITVFPSIRKFEDVQSGSASQYLDRLDNIPFAAGAKGNMNTTASPEIYAYRFEQDELFASNQAGTFQAPDFDDSFTGPDKNTALVTKVRLDATINVISGTQSTDVEVSYSITTQPWVDTYPNLIIDDPLLKTDSFTQTYSGITLPVAFQEGLTVAGLEATVAQFWLSVLEPGFDFPDGWTAQLAANLYYEWGSAPQVMPLVGGYYSQAHLEPFRYFNVTGIPWVEGYTIQIGDIVELSPPWRSAVFKAKVLEILNDTLQETVSLTVVEVP